MKMGTMFSDVARSLFRAPATESYPLGGHDVPAHARTADLGSDKMYGLRPMRQRLSGLRT